METPLRAWPVVLLVLLALLLAVNSAQPRETAEATFPGENGKILYENHGGGDEPDIFVVNADGSVPTNLTHDPAEDETPSWSPDGTRIVFASDREQNGIRKIYTMNADGSNVAKLTDEGGEFWPMWSPDGSAIVYRSGGDIKRVELGGGAPIVLHGGVGVSSEPDFSPDGSRIVFTNNEDGDFEIWVMDADGGNPTQLTHNSISDGDPSWSPDGTKIAFSSDVGGNREVWEMNADGSGPTNVTDNPADDEGPDWSPDGSLIAFYSDRSPGEGMYVMGFDGADPHLVVPGDVFSFEWQRPLAVRLQGDANCDGAVRPDDSAAIVGHLAGLVPHQESGCPEIGGPVVTIIATPFGDVDCSGDVTLRDGLQVLFYSAELPTTPEHVPCTDIGSALPSLDLPPP